MTKNETYGNVWRKVKHWFLFIFLELDAHVYIGGSIPTGKNPGQFFLILKKKKKKKISGSPYIQCWVCF